MADGLRKRKRGDVMTKGDLNIFEWGIANFAQAFEKTGDGERITSPVFVGKCTGLPNSFWRIDVMPKPKERENNTEQLNVYLVLIRELNRQNPVVKTRFELSLLDKNQQVMSIAKDIDLEFGSDRNSCGIGFKLATRSELLSLHNHNANDDIFRIQVKVWISCDEINGVAPKKQKQDQLNQHFSKLLAVSKFSDVDIVVEELTLKAHKNILSCRSPVFEAIFQNEMSESLTSVVKIDDFSSKTVKGMLEFIYSGNLENVDEDFIELLKIAEKYELGELKEACTKAAILKISVENVLDLLILGDMYNSPELKSKAMAFINSNKASPIFSSGNKNGLFETFAKEHPLLVSEMYQNLRKNDVDVHYSGEFNESIEEVIKIITDLKH